MALADSLARYLCSLLITLVIIAPNLIAVCVNYSGDRSSLNGHVGKDEFERIRAASRDLTIEEYSSAEYLLGPFVRIYTTERGKGPTLPEYYRGPHSSFERKCNRHAALDKEGGARARDCAPGADVQKVYIWGGITHVSIFGSVAPGVEWLHFTILTAMKLPAVFLGSRPKVALVAILGMLGSVLYAGLLLTLPFYAIALLLAYRLVKIVHPNGLVHVMESVIGAPPHSSRAATGGQGGYSGLHVAELADANVLKNAGVYPGTGEDGSVPRNTLGY